MIYINPAIGDRGGASVRVELDGRRWRIDLLWVPVELFWAVSIYSNDGVLLRAGMVARHGEDMLRPFTAADVPPGQLGAWDTTGRGLDPGRDDLRRTSGVRLVYIPATVVGS